MSYNNLPSAPFKLSSIILWLSIILCANNVSASNIPPALLNSPIHLITGETITLKDYQGTKPVYMKFWATWCQPCIKQMPHFEKIQQQYGDKLAVIGINLAINDNLAAVIKAQNKYALTMPMALDNSGDLAQGFNLQGTPYHLLFDKDMNLVHIGHESNKALDNKIALLTQNKPLELLASPVNTNLEGSYDFENSTQVILFSATWCDWYFAQSRPAMSNQCIVAQELMTTLSLRFSELMIQGQMSRLWTDNTAIDKYMNKYQVTYPVHLDSSNRLFHQLNIKNIPTLVLIKQGEIINTVTNFDNPKQIIKQIAALTK